MWGQLEIIRLPERMNENNFGDFRVLFTGDEVADSSGQYIRGQLAVKFDADSQMHANPRDEKPWTALQFNSR